MKKLQLNNILTIKNASLLNKSTVFIKKNEKTLNLILFLYKQGIIQSYSCSNKEICVVLRYYNENTPFKHFKLISKSSKIKFSSYKEICNYSKSSKLLLFSTDLGLCSQHDCIKNIKGGKLLFAL